jgi:hypothetical protein
MYEKVLLDMKSERAFLCLDFEKATRRRWEWKCSYVLPLEWEGKGVNSNYKN